MNQIAAQYNSTTQRAGAELVCSPSRLLRKPGLCRRVEGMWPRREGTEELTAHPLDLWETRSICCWADARHRYSARAVESELFRITNYTCARFRWTHERLGGTVLVLRDARALHEKSMKSLHSVDACSKSCTASEKSITTSTQEPRCERI